MRQFDSALLNQILDLQVFVVSSWHASFQVSEAFKDLTSDLVLVVVLDDLKDEFATNQLQL